MDRDPQEHIPDGRAQRFERLTRAPLDVLVVGGGITGAGIALDLALRGLRTGMVERADWASATSSASSRLIHGGLRYLEQFAFGLVRESCLERGLLLHNAAGLVWPEQFLFPVRRGDRVGRLKLAAGLGLYTLVSLPRALGLPRMHGKKTVVRRLPTIDRRTLVGGGSYHDGATDDARLSLAVVLSAMQAGAHCLSRTELIGMEQNASGIEAELADTLEGSRLRVRAKAAVLAGGPFTESLRERAGLGGRWVSPTRGSHIVLPRSRLPTDGAVVFPSSLDGRVMFLIPWPRYTIVGTTDLDADPALAVRATRQEVRYLLDSANALCPGVGLGEADVISTWAGLRPLVSADGEDPSKRSREERVSKDGAIYTIAGGKLTGYRAMAEKLAAQLTADLGIGMAGRRSPTRGHRLRGALPDPMARPRWSWLDDEGDPLVADPLQVTWLRRYAALWPEVERTCAAQADGCEPLDAETRLGEVDWAVQREDCLTAEDFFLRRTDLALGPLENAREAAPAVLARLAGLHGWDPERRKTESSRLERALKRAHEWREDA